MNFLIEEGFDKTLIDKLLSVYDSSTIDLFKLEEANVVDIIDYFNEIGIKNIDKILVNHIEIFISTKERVQSAFEKYDVKRLVEEINDDVERIEKI